MSNKLKTRAVVAIVVALLAYMFFKLFFVAEVESPPKPVIAQQENKQKADHLVVAIKKLEEPQKLSIPKLKIEVFDIVFGKTKGTGYTLIAYNDAAQQVYIVGANLSEGVVLKSLSIGEVLIDNHGRLEKYPLQVKKHTDKQITPLLSESIQPPTPLEDMPPKIDGSVPPPPPPREPVKPREYIAPPPSGGLVPE